MAGISETKWFGKAVYVVEGYTILHSGRPLPEESPMVRNEGVGIVLDPALTVAWRDAGEVWKAVSSRIVCARLKLAQDVRRLLRKGKSKPVFATIMSVYAPTFRATAEVKEEFSDLQATIDGVDEHDVLLIVGDFNARVGGSERGRDVPAWDGVRGFHGVVKSNEAGVELLSFCALNELAIMNTFFEKKSIHKHTWQHSGSKKWYCIDYVIMKQGQRRWCSDVSVVRSAECWTDHKLLRARLYLLLPPKTQKG